MNQVIYVETSIPGFYFETRPSAQMQARREWTREWWATSTVTEDLVSSLGVIIELSATPEPKKTECLKLIEALPLLDVTEEVDDLVET